MDPEKWDGTTWAGDVHNGEGVYSVKLHDSGVKQVSNVVAGAVLFLTLQNLIIIVLLAIYLF
jgi:hypothetical protein